jgi:acetoin utilization deacetylase AcuC-like enzyme
MKNIKVFYRDQQTVHTNDSFSPSAGKPIEVLRSWLVNRYPIDIVDFDPVSSSQIALAHDPQHVEDVLECKKANGFGNQSKDVARSLPYTVGSMVAAALHAFKTGEVCASLTSGFHHAGFDNSGGFCTFNGLMVAVQVLRTQGAKKIGIIDLDNHFGDGTEDIIKHLGLQEYVRHYTFGHYNIGPTNSDQWLHDLPNILAEFKDCDVILYQAGADPHIEDPLGGSLTTEQMRDRDRIVFSMCKAMNIPVAWNLAGGYQKPLRKVLDLHDATMSECVSAHLTGTYKSEKKNEK